MSPNPLLESSHRPTSKSPGPPGTSALETIFSFKSSQLKHQEAPLLEAREQFLSVMLEQGTSVQRMRSVASMLRHIIRLMELKELRVVRRDEIKEAALKWSFDFAAANKNHQVNTVRNFSGIAVKWLRFHKMLLSEVHRVEPDDTYTEQFVDFIQNVKGIGKLTASTHRARIRAFLRWSNRHNHLFEKITLSDVDEYITSKFEAGHKPTYIASICCSLRLFFDYAHAQSWNKSSIAQHVHRPRIPRFDQVPRGPDWQDVRRLVDHDFGSNRAALRAAAITSLSAIYALRSSEIIQLKLGDFDWLNEIVTIRRSKKGRVQQFPIQAEVGDKVIRYLRESRPKCKIPNLFVTLNPPYRPLEGATLWVVIASRLKLLGIDSRNNGVHALRHACATRLLHEGTPLPDIADFLGHRNLRSVSVYAKHDMESLRSISDIDLKGIL